MVAAAAPSLVVARCILRPAVEGLIPWRPNHYKGSRLTALPLCCFLYALVFDIAKL
jgi:hypothetical protein